MKTLDRFSITQRARELAVCIREDRKAGYCAHLSVVNRLRACRAELDVCRPDRAAKALKQAERFYFMNIEDGAPIIPSLLDHRNIRF